MCMSDVMKNGDNYKLNFLPGMEAVISFLLEAIESNFWESAENCTRQQWEKFENAGLDGALADIVAKAILHGMASNKQVIEFRR